MSLANTVSFQSDLANVIFGTAADPTREVAEVEVVERFRKQIEHATSLQIMEAGPFIDAVLIPMLSGRNRLAVAKMIEARAPAAIQIMPTLKKQREHLRMSAEIAQIVAPAAIRQMIEALRADTSAAGGTGGRP